VCWDFGWTLLRLGLVSRDMPKVVSLQEAKARDAEILRKVTKVQQAAQGHRQQTKIGQQRLEWVEQARQLAREARRLEADLDNLPSMVDAPSLEDAEIADLWFQVSGVRQLLSQVKQRDVERLRRAPEQAVSLKEVLSTVVTAVSGFGLSLTNQLAESEKECFTLRRALRRELAVDGAWPAERHEERFDNLSDEEDGMLDGMLDDTGAVGPYGAAYETELAQLNAQVAGELARLDKEIAELRRRRAGWDEEANFRFLCVKRQFQGRGRELLMDRLCLEFPHLSREQLQAHESCCDELKFTLQRQAAAFRQWRRGRLALLRQHQSQLEGQRRNEEAREEHRQAAQELKEKQRRLHSKLQVERSRASSLRQERQRKEDEDQQRVRAVEAQKASVKERHVHAVKELSRDFAERRREKQQQAEELAAEKERREAEERAQSLARGAERVRLRREMDELRRREAAEQRAAAEQRLLEDRLRLERALEQLRVEAPRDPERLLKAPARLQEEAYIDPLVCVTRGPGVAAAHFDERRLMADARYKLSAALQAAGLFGTKAGHEALSGIPAPRPAQQHMVSHIFDSGYPS